MKALKMGLQAVHHNRMEGVHSGRLDAGMAGVIPFDTVKILIYCAGGIHGPYQ